MESLTEKGITNKNFYFLREGGEMGELTRNFNWAETSLGTPDTWPGSLQTTIGIILHSAFPMFLFWGDELLCFYNDAYRPSLGNNGKHPAIGKQAAEIWPEIWEFIHPLIQKVRATGEAVWFEDQLLPIYRNGSIEDAYWTFSYSPVFDGSGKVGGVFVTCVESTKSVQAKAKLQESEKRFQHFVRDATVGIVVIRGDKMIIEIVNEAYAALLGRTPDDLYGKELFKVIPETEKQFKEMIDRVRMTGNPIYLYDHPYMVYVNGVEKRGYLNVVYQPYKEDDGTVTGVMALCHDVTEQVVSTGKVKEREEQVRSIIEAAPFPIGIYTGKDMRIEFVNQSILDAWKKDRDIIGKTFLEVLPEMKDTPFPSQLDKVFTTGEAFHARNQLVNFMENDTLQSYYFNYSYTPLFDENGKVYGVMNTAAEVTDLEIAKQQIQESELQIRNMILQAPVAMCLLMGDDHTIDVANDLMIELWGKPREQVMGKPVWEALPDAREQGLEELMQTVYKKGETFKASEMPVQLLRNGKQEAVYQNFVYEPYRSPDGKILGVLAITIDVTPQVMARQKIEEVVAERTRELASTNQELQRSNAELGQFAYIASHDLQEPIRKVSTFAQMLEHSLGEIDDRSKGYLTKINKSTERMIGLIRDVLSYSQLTKENNKDLQEVRLSEVIDTIKSDYELLIGQKEAKINYKNLPVINAIPLQMSQLFTNLISNALKFSREGVNPVISIDAQLLNKEEAGNPYYKITVQDNGIGFDQDHSKQIFNIFQRLHGRTEYSGTGIGLAICKKIAENHNGDIFATSVKGEGTCFTIILPKNQ